MFGGRWKNTTGAPLDLIFGQDVLHWATDETRILVYSPAQLAASPDFVDAVAAEYLVYISPVDACGNPVVSLPRTQDDGTPVVGLGPRLSGSDFIRASHNYCDPTTWWGDSVRSTDEALVDQGDGLTWESATPDRIWICVCGGNFLTEDTHIDTHGVTVKVNNVEMTCRDYFADDWDTEYPEDYYLDYANGRVIFRVSQSGNTVTATYSYENGSSWYVVPAEGKELYLEEAECNFSADIVLTDTICYHIEYDHPVNGWTPVDVTKYKTGWQYIQECRGNHPPIPAFGGAKRGIQNAAAQIPFIYVAHRSLKSSENVRLRVFLENDKPLEGEHGSITFWALSRTETT